MENLSDRLRRAAEEMRMGVYRPGHVGLMLEAAEKLDRRASAITGCTGEKCQIHDGPVIRCSAHNCPDRTGPERKENIEDGKDGKM